MYDWKHIFIYFAKSSALVGVGVLVQMSLSQATIVVTGDYDPADTNFWTDGGGAETGTIGNTADGTLTITTGSTVDLNTAYFGRDPSVTGDVTIEDSGSALSITQNLYIGYEGTSNLILRNGGSISTSVNEGFLGHSSTGVGNATVTGAGSQMSVDDDFHVGYYGTGTLLVEDGGYVNSGRFSNIGYHDGSVSSATVTGSGSEWYTNGRMYNGLYGTGTLNVEDGALVTVNNYAYLGHYGRDTDPGRGFGTANVTGAGSQWNMRRALFVGYWGTGVLNVEDGASVTNTNESVLIGFAGSGIGTVTIKGAGSQLNVDDDIYVGYYGKGTLNIEDGAVVTNRRVFMGVLDSDSQGRGNGTATVTGAGSQWNSSEYLIVARGGDAMLNIENGGVVNSADGYIGTVDTSSLRLGDGTVTVTGAGSQWNNTGGVDADDNVIEGNLYVGYDGNGALNIENGGLVTNADDGYIGYNAGSTGNATVTGAGSQWHSTGDLYVGFNGAGKLNVADGGNVTAGGDITIGPDGEVNLYVSGDGADALLSAGGTLNSSAGSIYLYAEAALAAGTYTPISAGTYNDAADHYVGVGGTWDSTNRTFTVAAAEERFDGVTNEDVSDQRIEFVDREVLISFSEAAGAVSMDVFDENVEMIGDEFVLQSYFFDVQSGDLSGEPMVVSFFVTEGYVYDAFSFWREETQGGTWDPYDPDSYSYSDGWVNFTVEGFSGYAVTVGSVVPEPSTTAIILGAFVLLLLVVRRYCFS